ncbi:hypothetical protein ACHAXT_008732 [Thalassiosira profunda]
MKPRSKRNRKRPRGGLGCLVGDGTGAPIDAASPSSLLVVDVVPLSAAFEAISEATLDDHSMRLHGRRRVRIVRPYPYTFATFAKARWLGRTVADVYHEEFGSYPRSYYEAAIAAGRILISGNRVDCDYKIKGGDELTHTVHRHEPAVGLADVPLSNTNGSDYQSDTAIPPVQIVHEDDSLLVIDKPATLPIHPCGGYNYNSLFEILSHWKPELYGSGNLFTVHRLDRLTSGLVLIAKSSALARSLGKCIAERDGCEKIYLARVKGRFPLNVPQRDAWRFQHKSLDHRKDSEDGEEGRPCKRNKPSTEVPPPCQYGVVDETATTSWRGGLRVHFVDAGSKKKSQSNITHPISEDETKSHAGLGYWMTNGRGAILDDASLQDFANQRDGKSVEEMLAGAIGSSPEENETDASTMFIWLNFACPCRIASHKNGVCEARDFLHISDETDRRGIKPAQTSFALLSYDATKDTSLVVAKPVTGRTHQIRLHLQTLGHPIANDHCYGGDLWFGDEEGKDICKKSREWLDRLDRGTRSMAVAPKNSTNADTPATEAEVYHAAANRPREEGESILDFIEKTCVWCARCRGVDDLDSSKNSLQSKAENEAAVFRRTLMEYLVRSQGIWLHALQYSLAATDESGRSKTMRYRTKLPSWATEI